jgi:hypothetical protein
MMLVVVAALAAGPSAARAQEAPVAELGGVRLSRAEAGAAAALARQVLGMIDAETGLRQAPSRQALVATIGERLKEKWPLAEPAPKIFKELRHTAVFVTLYGPNGADLTGEGRGTSVLAAVVDAACGLARSPRYRAEGFDRLAGMRLALDLTVAERPFITNLAEPFLYSMQLGVDGLIYQNADQRGVLLPWEATRRAWEMRFTRSDSGAAEEMQPARTIEDIKRAVFRSLLDRAGAHPATWRSPAAAVLRFQTQSFVEDRAAGGAEMVELYRVAPLVRPESLAAEDLSRAARLAADYLARVPDQAETARDGFDPLRNQWTGEFLAARQALVVQALARLYGAEKQPWMLRAAQGLARRLLLEAPPGGVNQPVVQTGVRQATFKSRDGTNRKCAYLVAGPRSELAATAQAVLALAELRAVEPASSRQGGDRPAGGPKDESLEQLKLLANTLLVSQKEDGSFGAFFAPATAENILGGNEENVRGESLDLLALARAYEATRDEDYLKAARAAAEYLVFKREQKFGRAPGAPGQGMADPYLIEALALLDKHLVNDGCARYAAGCAEAVMDSQLTDASRYLLDELGGFAGAAEPDTEYASFCLRGLRALERWSARLETEAPERYQKLGLATVRDSAARAARRAEAFLLGMQYTSANTFYAPEGAIAVGGLRYTPCDGRASTIAAANLVLAEGK